MDSTIVDGATYTFKGDNVDTALVAGFSTNGSNSLYVFALENGRIAIDGNGNSSGTPLNDELTRVTNSLDSINTAYYKAYEGFKGSAEEWASEYETVWVPKFKQQVLDSYQLHMNDVVGYVLTQFMSILSVDEQLELMNNFGSWLASTKRVSNNKSILEVQQNTAVGKSYVDI